MKKTSTIVAALVAVASITAYATAAPTSTLKTASVVSLKYKEGGGGAYDEGGVFLGEVSAKAKCERHRKVKVVRKGVGGIGKDRTNERGRYAVGYANAPAGKYFAKATKTTYRKGNSQVVCKAARSDIATVD